MQNESWMWPALQTSEAVLMPALEARPSATPRNRNRRMPPYAPPSVFRSADRSWELPAETSCAAAPVRSGSMAGRSVLRAAGVRSIPLATHPCRHNRT